MKNRLPKGKLTMLTITSHRESAAEEKFANSNTKREGKSGPITGGNSASARKRLRHGFIDTYGPIVPFVLFFDRLDSDMQRKERK